VAGSKYIQHLHIRAYGCLKDVELTLTPLHALIGPNDGGKSTVLMALRTITTQSVVDGRTWTLTPRGSNMIEESTAAHVGGTQLHTDAGSHLLHQDPILRTALTGSILLQLSRDALRTATELIQVGHPLRFADRRGLGLPAVYDAIMTRDLAAYMAINARLVDLFPAVKSLSLTNTTTKSKALGVQLTDGTFVSANFISEGMLHYLAYAALPHLEPTGVILIEQPENGLHPARIRDVMGILREVSKTTQVVITTHSPLVINELEGYEVTVLTRDPKQGTRARRMKDTPNFAERARVYALGELWVSYADGVCEAPLFTEPESVSEPEPGE
jgi:predicted ATPase